MKLRRNLPSTPPHRVQATATSPTLMALPPLPQQRHPQPQQPQQPQPRQQTHHHQHHHHSQQLSQRRSSNHHRPQRRLAMHGALPPLWLTRWFCSFKHHPPLRLSQWRRHPPRQQTLHPLPHPTSCCDWPVLLPRCLPSSPHPPCSVTHPAADCHGAAPVPSVGSPLALVASCRPSHSTTESQVAQAAAPTTRLSHSCCPSSSASSLQPVLWLAS